MPDPTILAEQVIKNVDLATVILSIEGYHAKDLGNGKILVTGVGKASNKPEFSNWVEHVCIHFDVTHGITGINQFLDSRT